MQVGTIRKLFQAAIFATMLLTQGCLYDNVNNLVKHTDEQIVATGDQLRANMQTLTDKITETLTRIDELVATIARDADNVSASVVANLTELTAAVTSQVQALGQLQAQFSALIGQGAQGLEESQTRIDAFLDGATSSMTALNALIERLDAGLPQAPAPNLAQAGADAVEGVKDRLAGEAARSRVIAGGPEVQDAAERYLETRGLAPDPVAAVGDDAGAAPLPAF